MNRNLLFALLLAAATTNAAAAQRNRAEIFLTERPAPRRNCAAIQSPRALPAVSAIADSAALAAAVANFARSFPITGPSFGVFSVAFRADGSVERVAPIDYMLADGQAGVFAGLIRSHLRLTDLRGPLTLRLRVDASETPTFRVGRSERCAPTIQTRFRVETFTGRNPQDRPNAVRARVVVEETGHVASVFISGSTGMSELDRWIRDSLLNREVEPGLIDEVPLQMEFEETVQVQTR
jgi:hypothetical protein